jgi:hypothetical protein
MKTQQAVVDRDRDDLTAGVASVGCAPVEERRTSTRFVTEPDTCFALIRHPRGAEITVEVHDESLGGLGLLLDDIADFDVGQVVEILYLDCQMYGTVCHARPYPDGRYLVGFECRTAPPAE